MSRINLVVKLL